MIKFLLDENISKSTKSLLEKLGYDAKSIADYKMFGCEDLDVLRKAALEERIILTNDLDFGNLMNHPVYYAGVIILRLDDQRPHNVNSVLGSFLEKADHDILPNVLVIVSESQYRIRSFK